MRRTRRGRRCTALLASAVVSLAGLLVVAPPAGADVHDKIAQTKAAIAAAHDRLATLTRQVDATQDKVDATKAQLEAITARMDTAVEDYDGARIELASAQRKAAAARASVAGAQRQVDGLRGQLDQLAAAAYRSEGSTDGIVQLFLAESTSDYLARAGTLDQLARGRAEMIRRVAVAQRVLEQKQQAADDAVGAARQVASRLAGVKDKIQADLASQSRLLASVQQDEARVEQMANAQAAQAHALADRLSHEQSQAAAEARAQAARAAAAAAAAAAERTRLARQATLTLAGSGDGIEDGGAAPSGPPPVYDGPASERGNVAVRYAYDQLGKPYQWGADGPHTFDCSGLTMMAWRQAGVALSHYSRAQWNEGTHVSRSDVRRGDLLFFGSPIHHVGIYIGDGRMIDAPHTGDVVKIQAAFRSDFVGATRPG